MTSKMFLTSVAAVMLAMPAMAEPWPSNDIMLENKTYDNAATEEHMLVSADGATANATADYEAILYQIAAGKYLPAGAESVIDCDQNGYFCPGNSNGVNYSESNAQGLTQCPDGYASSAAGASAANQCYKACTTSMVAHATGVKGNDYYADGADTCEPTSCAAGWHIKEGQSLNLAETIGTKHGSNSAYVNNSGSFSEANFDELGEKGQDYYGITDNMSWAIDFGDSGMVKGQAQCSSKSGTFAWDASTPEEISTETTLPDSEGQYCWCNLTGYKAADGSEMSLSSPWVFFISGDQSADYCARDCARRCTDFALGNSGFRSVFFGSVGASTTLASCAANTINIQWDGINEPTTVTYGGDIVTPVEAKKIPGQRFKGWKFTTPGQTTGD